MARLALDITQTVLDASGDPIAGAQLEFYDAGTTTPVTAYSDAALTTQHAFPIVADSAGVFAAIYLPNGVYKAIVKDADGAQVAQADNLTISVAGAENVKYQLSTVAQLKADTALSYGNGVSAFRVASGDVVQAGPFFYTVAATGVSDQHITTAGGVKLYVTAGVGGKDLESYGLSMDGSTDDATALQVAFNDADVLVANAAKTISIEAGQTVPTTARKVDLFPVTITQPAGANIAALITHSGYGNDYGNFHVRVDGNRDNNTDVTGVLIDGTAAGDEVVFNIAGRNCDTLAKLTKEIEHAEIKVSGYQCGTILEIDTTTNTPDENSYFVAGYNSDTFFKTSGASKTSGVVRVVGENAYGWAFEIDEGWLTLEGVVRNAGIDRGDGSAPVGGGVTVTASEAARIHFNGLQLYGTGTNRGTWGLLLDSASTNFSGTAILGAFDGGAWLKEMQPGSNINIELTAAAANLDAVKLGDNAGGKTLDGVTVTISTQGAPTANYAINLDDVRNSTIIIDGEMVGGTTSIYISTNSFDNTIIIDRGSSTRLITNARTQTDNTVHYRGNFTFSDLGNINGGTHFDGMEVAAAFGQSGARGPASYNDGDGGWVLHSNSVPFESDTSLGDATNHINTDFKTAGRLVFNDTSDALYIATGSGATNNWKAVTGSSSDITPS